jgi:hypothetical protein
MRICRLLQLAVLSVLVGSATLMFAQDEKKADDPPARQEDVKPEPKQDDAKPVHPDEAKPSKEEKQEDKQEKKAGQEQSHDQAMPNGHEQTAQARPAGKGGHIPDDKFKAHFGRGHKFAAKSVIVSGQPQFQYGGYSFQLVDVWPVGWAYTDECYIDYIDGEYFLFDLLHPGVQIAIFVVL